MPRHRSERGGADLVTHFSESREAKKEVSVTELLDQFKAETEPDAPQQPKLETVNGTGDSAQKFDALGLDENRDAGRLLMAIDELLNEAGVPEALIVHHMGHSGERSRGDSRIIDWPDATWKLIRENAEVEGSPRYFSAYGRDVYQAESSLQFNPETRRPALVGGNRTDASNTRLLEPLLEILRGSEDGMSGRQLEDAMVDAGHGRNASRNARQYAVKHGCVVTEPGKSRAVIHKIPPEGAPVRHAAPVEVAHHASESGGECASAPIEGARTHTTLAPGSNPEGAPVGTQPDLEESA